MVINTNPSKALVTLAVLTVTVVVALVLIFVAVPAMRGPLREQGSQISFRT
jgi:Tfp pilus assembly protein FimT